MKPINVSKPTFPTSLFSLVLLFLCPVLVHSQDWPQWRGANRDAKATSFTAPKTWPKELTQKWKVSVGEGVATPSLVGEKLFVFSRQNSAEVTRCLEAASGKEVWSDKYDSLGATGPASGFSGPRASPTIADGKVVTLGVRGVLSCLDASKGTVLWRIEDFKTAYPRFFTASSALIVDGLCLSQLGGGENGVVLASNLADGKEKWKWSGESPAYASPVLLTIDGTKLVIAMTETRIVGLRVADGKLVWEAPFAVAGRGYNAATPIADGDTLIYAGSGRGTTAVKLSKKGDGFEAKELWTNPENSVMFNTPVRTKQGALFGLSAGNDLFCINTEGKTAWKAPIAHNAAGGGGESPRGGRMGMGRGGFGSVVDAGTVLFALSPSSELVVFESNEQSFKELARYKVSDSPTYAYPVISGNRIFIKDQDSVILFTLE